MTAQKIHPPGRFVYHVAEDEWEWDDHVFAIHGFEPGAITPTSELITASKHPEDRDRVLSALTRAAHNPESFSVSYRLIRVDGTERRVVLVGCGLPREGGVKIVEGYYIDLTLDFDQQIAVGATRAVRASAAHRATIEQAKGALMLVYGLTPDAAFAMLRWWSVNHNVKIRELASGAAARTGDRLGHAA